MLNNLRLTYIFLRGLLELKCGMVIISAELISWTPMEQIVSFPCLSFPLLCFVCPVQTVNSPMQGLRGPTASSTCSWFPHCHNTNKTNDLCFLYQQQLSQTTFKENECRGFYSCHQTNICFQLLRKFPSISTALPMRFLHPPFPVKLQKIGVQTCK